ncbi:HpcH/HpaI aldolase/citrate lyase family protein [Striga asiatica]|uniref:HpcH/HpaI aldolase/citrate lyase family protein n=1 Tax=Striga asiatica TaxID=4170 RepID=A0A5A7PBD5_STRAF|nr:HpcH/HpaI aldolase/citrate lyase family protein [Striga asiatica]
MSTPCCDSPDSGEFKVRLTRVDHPRRDEDELRATEARPNKQLRTGPFTAGWFGLKRSYSGAVRAEASPRLKRDRFRRQPEAENKQFSPRLSRPCSFHKPGEP